MGELAKKSKIFLKNNYKFEGSIISADANFLKLLDDKTQTVMTFPISNIDRIQEVKNDC